MTDDKLFNLLVARTQTRETSTLAVVIIATATSLVLLGFVCLANEGQRNYIAGIGILYPILGIVYREIAYATLQNRDLEQIRKRLSDEEVDIVLDVYKKWPRKIIFYSLFLVFPIIAWVLVLTNTIC